MFQTGRMKFLSPTFSCLKLSQLPAYLLELRDKKSLPESEPNICRSNSPFPLYLTYFFPLNRAIHTSSKVTVSFLPFLLRHTVFFSVAHYIMEKMISTLHICNEPPTWASLSIPPFIQTEEHFPLLPFVFLARVSLGPCQAALAVEE